MTPRPTPRLIDAVLLDFGGVLVHWDPYLAYEGHLSRAEVERFFAEIDFPALNHLQDGGRSWADARRAVVATHPEHGPNLDLYVANFAASLVGPIPGSAELVGELRGLGLRLYGLTNWSAETFHHAAGAAPATTLLDDVLVSGRVGLAKPDPLIFDVTIRRFGLAPGRTLFVDDSPANLLAAEACGLRTHLFDGVRGLRAALIGLGVAVAPS